jgi:NADPH:quinone reductase-like Zn-dependent oxidoreductase
MKEMVISAFKAAPELVEAPALQAGAGEVNVEYVSVNGMDLMTWQGWIEGMMPYQFPITLGRDFSGTVGSVGSGVDAFKTGDPVFGLLMAMPLHKGTFATQIKVPVGSLGKRPALLDAKSAGALALAGGAAKAAIDAAAPKAGEVVLVSGATGGVGALAMQMLKARGAYVIATANPGQQTFVTEQGADEAVDFSSDLAA